MATSGTLLAICAGMTRREIRAMRNEAAEAGDMAQVAICDLALDGDEQALAECERVRRAAQAMQEAS